MAKSNEELMGFEIAGTDGKFAPATVKTEGREIIVFSSQVSKPVAVRYGFAPNPRCNLVNGVGLPTSPFRARVRQSNG